MHLIMVKEPSILLFRSVVFTMNKGVKASGNSTLKSDNFVRMCLNTKRSLLDESLISIA